MKRVFLSWAIRLLIPLACLTCVSPIHSQIPWFSQTGQSQDEAVWNQLLGYFILLSPTNHPDSVRITFYINVGYDLLQFVHDGPQFRARYDLGIAITTLKNDWISGADRSSVVVTDQFSETNDRSLMQYHTFAFTVSPGYYQWMLQFRDRETEIPFRKKDKIDVPGFFSRSFSVSGLFFSRDILRLGPEGFEGFPIFPPMRARHDTAFSAGFFVCSEALPLQLTSVVTVMNRSTVLHSDTLRTTLIQRIQPMMVPLNFDLPFGKHLLRITTAANGKHMVSESPLWVRWGSHSIEITDCDMSAEVLMYVMDENSWRQLISLPREEKEGAVDRFWKERNPNLRSETNPLEEEYYHRVAFANQNFSMDREVSDGWRSDRGRILIINGMPSDVERRPVATESLAVYEVWTYQNLQKKFVFLDRYGIGEFHLVSEE